jgi:hypothetical protein
LQLLLAGLGTTFEEAVGRDAESIGDGEELTEIDADELMTVEGELQL